MSTFVVEILPYQGGLIVAAVSHVQSQPFHLSLGDHRRTSRCLRTLRPLGMYLRELGRGHVPHTGRRTGKGYFRTAIVEIHKRRALARGQGLTTKIYGRADPFLADQPAGTFPICLHSRLRVLDESVLEHLLFLAATSVLEEYSHLNFCHHASSPRQRRYGPWWCAC